VVEEIQQFSQQSEMGDPISNFNQTWFCKIECGRKKSSLSYSLGKQVYY